MWKLEGVNADVAKDELVIRVWKRGGEIKLNPQSLGSIFSFVHRPWSSLTWEYRTLLSLMSDVKSSCRGMESRKEGGICHVIILIPLKGAAFSVWGVLME